MLPIVILKVSNDYVCVVNASAKLINPLVSAMKQLDSWRLNVDRDFRQVHILSNNVQMGTAVSMSRARYANASLKLPLCRSRSSRKPV